MTFEQWCQTCTYTPDAFEAECHWAGPVYAYAGGFIGVDLLGGLTVPICNRDFRFDKFAEAERFLWEEWVRDEADAGDIVDLRPFGIDRAAAVVVDGGNGEHRTTWGQFITDNRDGIEAGDVDPEQLARDLLEWPDRTAFGCDMGGRWSVRLLVGEEARVT